MATAETQFVPWSHGGPASKPADAPLRGHDQPGGPAPNQARQAPREAPQAFDPSDAVTALVLQYSTTLYRVAYSITRNAAEAEDAVQEAFLRVLRNQEKLGEIRDVRIWLIRITWNLVLDRKRRTKVRPETEDVADLARTLADVQPTADETLASAQSCQRILDLIDRLPSKERQALLLSAIEELSTVEIAA